MMLFAKFLIIKRKPYYNRRMQSDTAKLAADSSVSGLTVLRNILHFINDQVFQTQRLEKFYGSGTTKGIQANHARKLRMQLAALDTAQIIDDMDIPGYRLHQLTGDRKGIWSITVNANWRLTFEFTDGNVYVLNYEDYH